MDVHTYFPFYSTHVEFVRRFESRYFAKLDAWCDAIRLDRCRRRIEPRRFAAALSEEERRTLAPQIEQFLAGFETLERGEHVSFDFIRGEGVRFLICGKLKKAIAGDAFADALLSVWLGPNTVDAGLVRTLLGG